MTAIPVAAFPSSPTTSSEDSLSGSGMSGSLPDLLDAYERSLILAALAASGGHQRRAARILGVGATTLHAKLKRLHLNGVAKVGLAAQAPVATEEFRWRGRLESPHALEVRVASGSIRLEGSAGDAVEIVALKHSRPGRGQSRAVEIAVTQLPTGLSIATEHHEVSPQTSLSEMGVPRPQVDLRIKLPRDAAVSARTAEGDITVVGLAGSLRLSSQRGTVRVTPA